MERHVGKTDGYLIDRLSRVETASTLTDERIAEQVISKAIRDYRDEIRRWLKSSSNRPLPVPYEGTEVIGRYVRRGDQATRPGTKAIIDLVKKENGKGYYILRVMVE